LDVLDEHHGILFLWDLYVTFYSSIVKLMKMFKNVSINTNG